MIQVISNDRFVESAARHLAHRIRPAGSAAHAFIALSGGRTPSDTYRCLGQVKKVEWPSVSLFQTDERAVPPTHLRSNYRMIRETLLSQPSVRCHVVHRMKAENPDRLGAARAYDRLLPEALDLAVLGIGADGHIASVFPPVVLTAERECRTVPTMAPDGEGRLSLTLGYLGLAREVVVLARGREKAKAVARALQGDPRSPAACFRDRLWIVDEELASEFGDG